MDALDDSRFADELQLCFEFEHKPTLVSRSQLALTLGIKPEQVYYLSTQGRLKRSGLGEYDLDESIRLYRLYTNKRCFVCDEVMHNAHGKQKYCSSRCKNNRSKTKSHLSHVSEIKCDTCKETKSITEFYKGSGGYYRRLCRDCKRSAVYKGRANRERDYQERHGFSLAACGKWAIYNGLGHTPREPATIEAFKLFRARKRLIGVMKRIRDSKPKPKNSRLVEVNQTEIWNYYNEFGRIKTVAAARNDWFKHCSLSWFLENQIKAPSWRFETPSIAYKWNYRNINWFNLQERNRRRITKMVRRSAFNAVDYAASNTMRGRVKDSQTLKDMVGYSSRQLRDHIEGQFRDGMSWARLDEIHIDHIVPCSMFDFSIDGSVKACWSLDNLQPLWAKDNYRKSDRIDDVPLELLDRNIKYLKNQKLSGSLDRVDRTTS